ncbi:MAG: carboxypeptidase regulatory-like domain-containing protein [Myxococcales bacterium]|nr:carboxypeptidase regulatory-like domain-containing protein [Myxococcales bacterium]
MNLPYRFTRKLIALCACTVVTVGITAGLSACSSEDGGDATPAKTLTYTGTIADGVDGKPVADVEVCLPDITAVGCVKTDAKGAFTLANIPAATKVKASVTKDGYIPVWATFITRDADNTLNANILQKSLVELAFKASGVTLDLKDKGGVLFLAYDPAVGQGKGLAGIAGELNPKAGDGPFYNQGSGLPKDATSTSDSGTGVWVNVAPGNYAMKASGAGRTCPGTFHWKAKTEGWIDLEVKAGHVTYAYVDCAK